MTNGSTSPRTGSAPAARPASRHRRRAALLAVVAALLLAGASCKYLDPANRAAPVPGATNGQLPPSYLASVGTCTVYDEASASLRAMIEHAKADGITIRPTSCYRDYAGQVAARNYWCGRGACNMAATPGGSNHGWGKAVDFADQSGQLTYSSKGYEWMILWSQVYGWIQPANMRQGGSLPEPWHFEWTGDGGRMFPGEYWGLHNEAPAVLRGTPFGFLDAVPPAPGAVRVVGWAIDPDQVSSTTAKVWVDGQLAATVPADANRPDVGAAFPLFAAAPHGIDATVRVAPGAHTVCVDAVNRWGAGSDRPLGCRSVTVG